jgi:hypothetical protein
MEQLSGASTARPDRPAACDEDFTVVDRKLHERAAVLAGQRRGVRQAARSLAHEEPLAPADHATEQKLKSKHPPANSRVGIKELGTADLHEAAQAMLSKQGMAPQARPVTGPVAAVSLEPMRHSAGAQQVRPIQLTEQQVGQVIRDLEAGKASGQDGLRPEHVRAWMGRDDNQASGVLGEDSLPDAVRYLTKLANILLAEPSLVPEQCWRLLRAGSLLAVGAKGRPIALLSVWRRVIASAVVKAVHPIVAPILQQQGQFGAGVRCGTEHVAASVEAAFDLGYVVIQLDVANAFNTISREFILLGLEEMCPKLLPLFTALYCGEHAPEMRYELRERDGATSDMVHFIDSEVGCQQGDPLSPLWFSVGLTYALHHVPGQQQPVPAPCPIDSFLDDMNARPGHRGEQLDAEAVERIWEVQRRLKRAGLELNVSKSRALAPSKAVFSAESRALLAGMGIEAVDAARYEASTGRFRGDKLHGTVVVGVPIGTPSYVAEYLRRKLGDDRLWDSAWQLGGMGEHHLQRGFLIFRRSFCSRMGHLARNVGPSRSRGFLECYDHLCTWTLERMLGLPGAASGSALRRFFGFVDTPSVGVGMTPTDVSHLDGGEAWSKPALDVSDSDIPPLVTLDPDFGPAGLEGLLVPHTIAHLPPSAGGLGLPQLASTCDAAYVARNQEVLLPRFVELAHARLEWQRGQEQEPVVHSAGATAPCAVPTGFSNTAMVREYRAAIRSVLARMPDESVMPGYGTPGESDGQDIRVDSEAEGCDGELRGFDVPDVTLPGRFGSSESGFLSEDNKRSGGEQHGSANSQGKDERDASMSDSASSGEGSRADGRQQAQAEQPLRYSPLHSCLPAGLLDWAARGRYDDHSTLAALQATALTPKPSLVGQQLGRGVQRRASDSRKVQATIAGLLHTARRDQFARQLQTSDELRRFSLPAGASFSSPSWVATPGVMALAQLRSQSAQAALGWLSTLLVTFDTPTMAVALLNALMVDSWVIVGGCPYSDACGGAKATCLHAWSCSAQHRFGNNQVHTHMKRTWQAQLRQHHVPRVDNEVVEIFTAADRRADTVVRCGAMGCGRADLQRKGVVFDTSVCSVAAAAYLRPRAANSATQSGFAAARREAEKDAHHRGTLDQRRWVFAPVVQESSGRLGRGFATWVRILAKHAAVCKGGSTGLITRNTARLASRIREKLSSELAWAQAQRVQAYVRGARLAGRDTVACSTRVACEGC